MGQYKIVAITIFMVLFLFASSCTDQEIGINRNKNMPENKVFNDEPGENPANGLGGSFHKYDPPINVTYGRETSKSIRIPEDTSYTQNIWIEDYKNELGIILNTVWEAEGIENYTTKLNIAMANNKLPDIFKVKTTAQLQRLVEANKIEDLTEVYEKHAPLFVKKNLAKDGGAALAQCTFQDRLMALPVEPLYPKDMEYIFIRDDWRKKLDLSEPKTMEDLFSLIRAFVNQDPDGNIRRDTYGLGLGNKPYDSYMGIKGFANGYGAYPNQWIEREGKLIYGSLEPEMKNALEGLRALYNDGFIDRYFVAKGSFSVSKDTIEGRIGILYGQCDTINWPLSYGYENNNKADWTGYNIPYVEGIENLGVGGSTRISDIFVVRKGFEYPEALLALHYYYMDKIYIDEDIEEGYVEDEYYETLPLAVVGGGIGNNNIKQNMLITKAIDKGNNSYLESMEQVRNMGLVKDYIEGDKDATSWAAYKYFYGDKSIFARENYYRINNLIRPDMFYGADTWEMMIRMPLLITVEEEMILKIITGEKPLEYFDEFVERWYDMGGRSITNEVNNWYRSVSK